MLNLRHLQFEYEPSFRLLVQDFEELLAFVEPVDANLATYSHRSYELLLRACTEFESLSKQASVAADSPKQPSNMNVLDYVLLEASVPLSTFEVGMLIWRPKPTYVRPFSGWQTVTPPLNWYNDYNKVKHNRNTEFSRASLENLRLAICALYLLLVKTHVPDLVGVPRRIDKANGVTETLIDVFPYSRFSVRV